MGIPVHTTTAPAARLRRPSWQDPRLLIGVLLVLASVAGVVALVQGADRTTEIYAARTDIGVGQNITPDDLAVVKVRLDETQAGYLPVSRGLADGVVATALIRAGELVPAAALGRADALGRKPVALELASPLPEGTGKGDHVDVWVSLPAGEGGRDGYAEPRMLLRAAEIHELAEQSSALGASRTTQLHVLVDDDAMPALLGALAGDARIAVVLNPGGA